MATAVSDGSVVDAGKVFVHNTPVVITPRDDPAQIKSLADLKKPGIKLVLAAPEVPIGNYSRQVLMNADKAASYGADFSGAVLKNVVSNEANVKDVVAKVQLGEADAGIVYGTDVTPSVASALNKIEIASSVNVVADYPIAVTKEAKNVKAAHAFVDFVLSNAGQTILKKWGFQPV
jgi:molybdate transport system substrate-binding protein